MIRSLLISFLILPLFSFGQGFVIENGEGSPYNLSSEVSIYEDTSASLSLDQVKSKTFKKNTSSRILLPFSDHITWLKLDLTNKTKDKKDWVFYFDNPLIRKVTFYNKLDSTVYHPFAIREIGDPKRPNFEIKLKQGESQEYYFKLESVRGNYVVFQLYDSESYKSFKDKSKIGFGFMNGLNLMTIFVVVVVGFLVVKDSRSKVYVAYIFFKTISLWSLYNVLGPAITKNPFWAEKIAFIGGGIIPMIIAILLLIILPLDKLPPYCKKLLHGTIVINFIILFGVAIQYNWVWLKLLAYFHLGVLIFAYFTLIYTLIKKTNKYPYYAIPFLIGSSTSLILHLRLLGYIIFSNIVVVAVIIVLLEIGVYVYFLSTIFRKSVNAQAIKLKDLTIEAEKATQLKELDKLKTNFFTNVSHELRTPLTLISAPINDLVSAYPNERLLQLVQRNTTKLKNLVNQILDVQKIDGTTLRPKIEQFDIAQSLRILVSSFESLAESRNIELTYQGNANRFSGYSDQDKIEKIVNNLLSNAFKFTPSGGRIRVNTVFTEDGFTIEVADTGVGISEEQLPFIFDRFFEDNTNAKGKMSGTGIGLSMVNQYVKLLRGEVCVKSAVNEGTQFTVKLPANKEAWKDLAVDIQVKEVLKASEVLPSLPELTYEGSDSSEKPLLLLVEDNHDMRTYLHAIFKQDYHIIEARNGSEGIAIAQNEIPDLIVSDLMMPEMNGFEFSEQIKTNDASNHVPIIMLTAKSGKETKLESYDLGIDHFLSKPFDKDELLGLVKNTLHNRRVLQQTYSKEIISENTETSELKTNEFLQKFKEYLQQHVAKSGLNTREMAADFNLSEKQFGRKIKSLSGSTPKELLRKFRLQKAADLLQNSELNVSEIAYSVGHENLSYFTKSFTDEYGITPSKYASE